MKSRQSILAILVCLLSLAWVSTATAAERNYWKHSRGHFENTTGNRWVEKIDDSTYRFVEVERTEKFIELYDKGRDCYVHLHDNACWVRDGKNGKWEKYYNGRWGR